MFEGYLYNAKLQVHRLIQYCSPDKQSKLGHHSKGPFDLPRRRTVYRTLPLPQLCGYFTLLLNKKK